uniref:RING-type domain-containing protein n=1 Tax=Astyanax mexicanus TaxID=7994 RepID=A0A3B1IDY4_ASTMX
MMATALEQQIQCSVCLGGFTDPVILPCEHLFCRQCILKHLQENKNPFREARCPDCRNTFRQEDLRDNRPVRNIVENQQQQKQQQQDCSCNLCPEHEEKLKLFCETDQTLICLICRDSLQHRCHSNVFIMVANNDYFHQLMLLIGRLDNNCFCHEFKLILNKRKNRLGTLPKAPVGVVPCSNFLRYWYLGFQ